MRAVVCLRFGLDVAELRPDPVTGAPRVRRAPWRLDPFSHHALEAAVRLKEAHGGGTVVTLSVVARPPPRQLQLEALAGGADELHLVVDPSAEDADALGLCHVLAASLRALEPWDVVLCGDAAADRYERQVGPRLAEALGLPLVSRALSLRLDGRRLFAERSLEESIDAVEAPLPAVVTVTQEINEPRLPALLQVMAASSKPTVVTDIASLGLTIGAGGASGSSRLDLRAPPSTRRRERIDAGNTRQAAQQLAQILAAEGLVDR